MVQKNTDKTEKTDIIKDYYENCKKAASCALGIAGVSVIAGLETVIALTAISFSGDVSLLQICLFIFLTLILLCIAGTAVFLYVSYMKKQKEYVEYMKEKQAFSSCEKIVGEMEKSEDRDQMRTYIIKTGMSRFR